MLKRNFRLAFTAKDMGTSKQANSRRNGILLTSLPQHRPFPGLCAIFASRLKTTGPQLSMGPGIRSFSSVTIAGLDQRVVRHERTSHRPGVIEAVEQVAGLVEQAG